MQWSPNKQGKFRNAIGDETAKRPTPQERNTFSTDVVPEKAILVAVCPGGQTLERTDEYLAELAFLLETAGGVCIPLIPKNTKVPHRVSRVFTTSRDNQDSVIISIFQGEGRPCEKKCTGFCFA